MLARHGYAVLMIDMRGQGQSEGDPNGWGWGSSRDIDAAVRWLQARPDVRPDRIGGLGLSVGGEQLLEAAARNPGLAAVATEGTGWRSANEGLARHGLPRVQVWVQLVQDWMLTAATAILSGQTPPPSLLRLVPQIAPRPILFMVGEHDNTMEAMLTPVYYTAAHEPKSLWTIPGAGHTAGLAAQPQAYAEHVLGFFDRALLAR
jgi:pimeloyl-ACP methyl ester carboxylesterase